jgi:hypothetical protein
LVLTRRKFTPPDLGDMLQALPPFVAYTSVKVRHGAQPVLLELHFARVDSTAHN